MTVAVPLSEPRELRAGATWEWRREDLAADYPAGTWSLKYWFKRIRSPANFSIDATADGAAFAVSVAATTTVDRTPGDYTCVAQLTSGGTVHEINRFEIRVLPKYASTENLDDRTHAKKMLDAIEAELEGNATAQQIAIVEHLIGNRSYKYDHSKLHALRLQYRAEVKREDIDRDLSNGRRPAGRLSARL